MNKNHEEVFTMTNRTKLTIEFGKHNFGTREFTESEWTRIAGPLTGDKGLVQLRTLIKNGVVKTGVKVITRTYSINEIIEELNDCAGEDCYNGDWHYYRNEEGTICQDFRLDTYRFI